MPVGVGFDLLEHLVDAAGREIVAAVPAALRSGGRGLYRQ
jgi:hypothetical protein